VNITPIMIIQALLSIIFSSDGVLIRLSSCASFQYTQLLMKFISVQLYGSLGKKHIL